jgi:hypothetical protein
MGEERLGTDGRSRVPGAQDLELVIIHPNHHHCCLSTSYDLHDITDIHDMNHHRHRIPYVEARTAHASPQVAPRLIYIAPARTASY